MPDLSTAYQALRDKQEPYNLLWRYYDGEHPLVYNATKLKEIFKGIDATFNENWSAVVVNTTLDRISIERFQVGDGSNEAVTDALLSLWRQTGLDLDAYDAHLCALVTGEAFIVCGQDAEGMAEAYYNDSRLCHLFYEDARPHVPRMAAKWWEEATPDGRGTNTFLTLYYADHFEYYAAKQKRSDITGAEAFVPAEPPTAPNPWGEIPVYHIRRERRVVRSEMADIITPQAQLNKMLSDMMIAGEFGAWPQRYIISQVAEGKFKNAPNEIWPIPASDGEGQATSAGQFDPVQLENYLGAIERTAGVIATIASIPKILLFAQGDIPSGASLRALEAPLVRKAERYAARWEATWRRVLRWLLRVGAGQDVPHTEIDIVWAEPATTQPEIDAQTVKTLVEAGMPLRTALRKQGWSDAELDQLEQDQADERQASADLAGTLLDAAEANANRIVATANHLTASSNAQPVVNGNGGA